MYSFEKKEMIPLKENYLKMGETNPDGEKIYTNNLYLTKNDQPFVPVMGEVHISRLPREEWEDRILKIKAIGITTIASYIFWINHEFEEGKLDFTGENDIGYFIDLCKKHGLQFCLRLGPWVNAEYRNGGLPDWLYRSGIKLRENNEEYLFYVRRYFEALYENIKPYLYKNGGNIIMIQFDNELTDNPEHILKLKEIAISVGLTAPIYTATGWNVAGGALLPPRDVLPMFGGYAAKPWSYEIGRIKLSSHYNYSHIRNSGEIGNDLLKPGDFKVNIKLEEYPHAYCELGAGVCVGKHRRPYISGMDDYAMSLTKLGSGSNLHGYYLICGGINKTINNIQLCRDTSNGESCIYPIFNNYFQAPIGEHGEYKEDSYRLLKLVNLFIRDFGSELADMQPFLQSELPKDNDDASLRYAMRYNGKSGYIFVNHYQHLLDLKPVYGVQFKVDDNLSVIPEKPIDVVGECSFFFPFNKKFGSMTADYIMAQPICKTGNTYFFKEISGVKPVYKFADEEIIAKSGKENGFTKGGYKFITLTEQEAAFVYKFDGEVYLGCDCDIIYDMGNIKIAGYGAGEYFKYNGTVFEKKSAGEDVELAQITVKQIENPDIEDRFKYELFQNIRFCPRDDGIVDCEAYMAERNVAYFELEVSNSNGYVHIVYSGDTAQLYYDGIMCDDNFYNGMEWIVPAKYLYGKKVVLAISEYTHDIYVDIEPKTNLSLDEVYVKRT
ncbi:MAG: beta-galactosidase [Clostridia bacterium]|nr:beta-galactosidase [Clostridia bacterium]